MSQFIFIIGIGRSGTSLLQSVLNSHSQIGILPETHFIKRYIHSEIKTKKYKEESFTKLIEDVSKDPLLKTIRIDSKVLGQKLAFEENGIKSVQFFSLLFKENHPDLNFYGDKDPLNVNYLKTIKLAYPNAKIINIIRDPRDVLSSRLKVSWNKMPFLFFHLAEYRFGLRKSRKEGRELFKENYVEIQYESLVLNTSKIVSQLCSFLGLNFEQSMLSPEKKASELIRPDELKWKQKNLLPIDGSSIGKWRKSLSTFQVKFIESSLSYEMKELGYEISQQPSFLFRKFAQLMIFPIELIFKLRFS